MESYENHPKFLKDLISQFLDDESFLFHLLSDNGDDGGGALWFWAIKCNIGYLMLDPFEDKPGEIEYGYVAHNHISAILSYPGNFAMSDERKMGILDYHDPKFFDKVKHLITMPCEDRHVLWDNVLS